MQWQYTMTKQEIRAQIRALTRIRGSIAGRQIHRLRLVEPLVFAAAMLVFSLIQLGGLPTEGQMGEAVFLLILIVLMALLIWALVPAQYVSIQMSALRRGLAQMTSQPYTVRLEEGMVTVEGPGISGERGQIRRRASDLETIQSDRAGLVLVFQDGAGLLMPLSAFSEAQPLPYSLSLFEQARHARPAAPEARTEQKEPAGPVHTGFVPDSAGGGTFVQTIDRETAGLLLRERAIAVLKTTAYWRRKWPALVLILLGGSYLTWQYGGIGLLVLAAAVAAVAYGVSHPSDRELDRISGTFTVELAPDALHLDDGKGGSWCIPYAGCFLLETPHSFVLCRPGATAGFSFARSAFGNGAEQEAFLAALNARLGA